MFESLGRVMGGRGEGDEEGRTFKVGFIGVGGVVGGRPAEGSVGRHCGYSRGAGFAGLVAESGGLWDCARTGKSQWMATAAVRVVLCCAVVVVVVGGVLVGW